MWAMMNVLERVEKRKSAFLYIKKQKSLKGPRVRRKKEKRDKRENILYCYFQQTGSYLICKHPLLHLHGAHTHTTAR